MRKSILTQIECLIAKFFFENTKTTRLYLPGWGKKFNQIKIAQIPLN
jgi:hypothetical protein